MGFDTFLGNPEAVAEVREMLRSGHVPGALLFAGPDGVGKRTLARMVAKAQVCERGSADFCDQCASCLKAEQMFAAAAEDLARRQESKDAARRVEGLVYFDLQIIEPITKFILTEQIRQLRTAAYTRPFELSRRIFIVDDAQTIHWQAVDLLLKVLEEPPETTQFVLICPNAFELRSTIRSRCTRIPFQLIDKTIIHDLLTRERKLSESQITLATHVAAGSVGRALNFDPAEYQRRRQPWLDFLDSIARGGSPGSSLDWKAVFDSARALAENRDDFETTLRLGYSLLSDLIHVLVDSDRDTLVNIDLVPRLKEWAPRLTIRGIEKLKAGLDQAYRLQIRNVNPQLGFDTLGIEIMAGHSPSLD
jgi:DNA polymerase-3 subunit delta'